MQTRATTATTSTSLLLENIMTNTPSSTPMLLQKNMTQALTSNKTNQEALLDALDDIHTRFILNLPSFELTSSDRIFFQLEQAYWFYEDFYCESSPNLPRFRYLRPFAEKMFDFSPLLRNRKCEFDRMWEEFTAYKRGISTYGTILLNDDCSKVILCLDWHGKAWTFPAGKINQNESAMAAGARETYEETGFDPHCLLGLTRTWKKDGKVLPWSFLKEEDALAYTEDETGKRRTCYVCRGVPEDFPFAPVSRKEVSEVAWHDLNNLPKKSFAVYPFVGQLKRWIRKNTVSTGAESDNKKRSSSRGKNNRSATNTPTKKRDASSGKKGGRPRSRPSSRGKVRPGDSVAESCLANVGDLNRWTEKEMFLANERLIGRKIEYDGNPHKFHLDGDDPHRFHVVGGTFMNSDGNMDHLIAPPPDKNKLQPLLSRENITPGQTEKDFQPFFSDGGITPWGDVVTDVASDKTPLSPVTMGSNASGLAILNLIQGPSSGPNKKDKKKRKKIRKEYSLQNHIDNTETGNILLTDAEITSQSQYKKLVNAPTSLQSKNDFNRTRRQSKHWKFLQDWAEDKERPPPTKMFGQFKFNVSAIMNAMSLSCHAVS